MQNSFNDIDDVIGKVLAGEANTAEKAFIDRWITESEQNKRYFEQLKTIFIRASSVKYSQQFDTDAAWLKVRQKLKAQNTNVISIARGNSYKNLFLRIAASIIIVLTIGFFAYNAFKSPPSDNLQLATTQTIQNDTLPEGSNVVLNKQTQLTYQFDKKKNAHIVNLKGEAYFAIKNNDDKDFIIVVNDVYIKDIGTSFNVKAYPNSNRVEVVVEEGEVMFYTDKDSGLYLKANGKGVYDKQTHQFFVEQPEPNVTAYKTKYFIFSDIDLLTLVNTVNDVYNKKIIIDEKLHQCRLTVSFKDETVDEIADVIAETLTLSKKDTPQGIVLEGAGCAEGL